MVAALLALLLAAPAHACPPSPGVRASRFTPGEQLRFRLDVLGADVGSFDLVVETPQGADRGRGALVLRSRAKTSAFVSTNMGRYEAFVAALVAPDLAPIRYREEIDEGDTHRTQQVEFPPRDGKLHVAVTKDGQPEPVELDASPGARDMVSALYFLRGQPLKTGQPLCAEVYAARRMWRMEGSVGPREQIDTPLGRFAAVRLDLTAIRADDPEVRRAAHVWLTDDDRRVPVAVIGDVKGKTIRAQLVEAAGAGLKTASTRPERKTGAPRVGAAIGR